MKYGAIYPSLEGRGVLVTGGASGIGEAVVLHFAAQGARTAFLDMNREAGAALADALNAGGRAALFVPVDLTDIAALKAAVEAVRTEIGPITVLVNNAARDDRHDIADVTSDYFDTFMARNLKHYVFTIQAVLPDMMAAGGGAIINMGSGSWLANAPGMPIYTAAKAGIQGLTRGLSKQLGEANIRINSIAPGWVRTERQTSLWVDEELAGQLVALQALHRVIEPDDIARTVLFLASDESSAMTSQNIIVDGGYL